MLDVLCHIYPTLRQWMLNNFFIEKEETGNDRDMALQIDDENILGRTCEQQGSCKENGN